MESIQYNLAESMHKFKKLFGSIPVPGLSRGEFFLLMTVSGKNKCGCMGVSKIADNMDVPMPSVSRTLKSLEKRGLIKRETDSENRRNVMVSITDSGLEALDVADKYLRGFMDEVVKELNPGDAEEITRILNDLYVIFEKKLKNGGNQAHDKDNQIS